jgi:hypothetical protein
VRAAKANGISERSEEFTGGDTRNGLHPEKTPLLAVTKKPNHTQNESHAIMRQRKKE